jgi:hypothetical protein
MTKKISVMGEQHGGLYLMDHYPTTSSSAVSFGSHFDLWHWRLGHPAPTLSSQFNNIDSSIKFSNKCSCTICPLAKQTRLQFSRSSITTVKCFELVHFDVWGPYNNAHFSGAKFFLTVVDDFSRSTWVFLMNHKSEVNTLIPHFFKMIEKQFQAHIQKIQSDNAREFFNSHTNNFFKDLGVLQQSSCAYTPQQNGVVERKHRHLLNVARALHFQSNLPLDFWGDFVLTATYLINRLPTNVLKGQTPHEILFKKKPNLSHLRVFGCLVYGRNTQISHKFDNRASPGVFLGYPHGQKGYKILDLFSKNIYVTRDAIFHEHIFPYKMFNAQKPSLVLPLPPTEQSSSFLYPFPPDEPTQPPPPNESSSSTIQTAPQTNPLNLNLQLEPSSSSLEH